MEQEQEHRTQRRRQESPSREPLFPPAKKQIKRPSNSHRMLYGIESRGTRAMKKTLSDMQAVAIDYTPTPGVEARDVLPATYVSLIAKTPLVAAQVILHYLVEWAIVERGLAGKEIPCAGCGIPETEAQWATKPSKPEDLFSVCCFLTMYVRNNFVEAQATGRILIITAVQIPWSIMGYTNLTNLTRVIRLEMESSVAPQSNSSSCSFLTRPSSASRKPAGSIGVRSPPIPPSVAHAARCGCRLRAWWGQFTSNGQGEVPT